MNKANLVPIFCVLALLTLPVVAFSQSDNIHGVVRTPNGYLVVWNEPGNNFTLSVKGKQFEQVRNRNLAFLIDGKFLEITTAATKDILSESGNKKDADDKDMLAVHRDWETAFFEKSAGEKVTVDSEFLTLSNNISAMLWSFAVPKSIGSGVERQFFLTWRNRDSIIVLNGASTKETAADIVRSFLIQTGATMRGSKEPLSQEDAVKLAGKLN